MSLWAAMTATKSLESLQAAASSTRPDGLQRVLGPWRLVMLGIGDIIGAGIFVLTGLAAAQYAGPAILLSFLLAAVAAGFAALCYSEFAAMIPVSGSAYTYAYATLGEFAAWTIGCLLVLEYAVGPSAVAVGWSGYLLSLFRDVGVTLPPAFTAPPGTVLVETAPGHWEVLAAAAAGLAARGIDVAALPHTTALFNALAAAVVLVMTAVLLRGVHESANVNAAMVVVKVGVILVFILAGAAYVRPEHWTPFVPPNAGEFGRFGASGVVRGAAVVFFAYMGFDAVTTAAQEARHPQRDLPIGILGSLASCAVLYVLVTIVLTGLVPYTALDVPDPIAVGVDATGLRWLSPLVKLGALTGLSTVILVGMLAQSRIFYTMAGDGLLPPWVGELDPVRHIPRRIILVTGVAMALLAALTPIGVLSELVSLGTLLIFVIVCAGVVILRRTRPDLPRPFRTPGSPVVPALGVLTCGYLMAGLPAGAWLRLAAYLAAGTVVYLAYGRAHGQARTGAPDGR